jgi:lysophospholipase L1-like esterase
LSSAASLLGAELLARRLFGVPLEERLPIVEVRASPTRGYEMVPDRDHYTYLHPVHVNHLGLRGEDLPEKARDECRVLCLGDSLVYGQGVADEDTIPSVLERELAGRAVEARRSVRVVNAGVRGYDTAQERALLEELGDRIRPDVVLLFWYENDLEKPRIEAARASLERSGPVAYDTERRMEGLPLALWRGRQLLRRSALVVRLRHVLADLAFKPLPPGEIERGFRRLDQDLGRMASWTRDRQVLLVVATLPDSTAVRVDRHPEDDLRERVRELARARGIPCVDPTPELRLLRGELGAPPILPYDGHYDGRANRAIARRLAPALQELLPTRL